MSRSDVIVLPLPDAAARSRIADDLNANLLVEAGAGSGKTTELVTRMVALVESGTASVEQIAAVTFTRKAAGELRERFQTRLEERIREGGDGEGDSEGAHRIRRALDEIHRAFVGTIHAFCARLLREHPLEVGLDPGFEELPAEERKVLRRRFWGAYLERLSRDVDPVVEELSNAGLRPNQLFKLFDRLVENPDVRFPTEEAEAPSAGEISAIRTQLGTLVDTAWELMPAREPDPEWDSLQRKMRTLHFTRDVTGWKSPVDFFDALALVCKPGPKGHAITLKRWKDGPMAKALREQVDAFGVGEDKPAHRLLNRWYANRYALAVRLARQAAEEFAEHRRTAGGLDFQDLLLLTARLLRGNPDVRRELGERYRRVLVDEFQDTDPLQAEVILLLASDPEGDGAGSETSAGAEPDWRLVVPRPGALFVVGDPKQSIYRFRRADIQLYDFVKQRFRDFGDVLELISNFRSRAAIGDLVNEVFDDDDFFPAETTPEQARFEPLRTRPRKTPAPAEGVFWYAVAPDAHNRAAVTDDDAARIASWIRTRIDSGERVAGDFMILTRTTHYLAAYARALEAHSIPVQVTGAGVGMEHELEELVALLECMIDPTNPLKVVAVLVGLFFGLDYEALVEHRLTGGSFDVVRPGSRGQSEVVEALAKLHEWWRTASTTPADVFVGQVVSELGLLPYAAAGDLGSVRAGALVFVLDAVRAAALAGDASLPGALDALRTALDAREAEAPLEPGRPDVVRVMNLHQAKGLEANVVVLADPSRERDRPPEVHTQRLEDGTPVCWVRVTGERASGYGDHVLARPAEWQDKENTERRFEVAERVRLLYVAVTRARDELVVARRPGATGITVWSALDPWLEAHGISLALDPEEPAPREELRVEPAEVAAEVREAEARLTALAVPSYRHLTVTQVAKGSQEEEVRPGDGQAGEGTQPAKVQERTGGSTTPDPGAFRGYSWGSAVHGALATAANGATERRLRAACRSLLVENGRPLDDHGEPLELEELLALVRAVRASTLWARAAASDRVLTEVPFAAPGAMREAETLVDDEREPEEVASRARKPGKAGAADRRGHRQLDLFGPDARPEEEALAADGPTPARAVLEGVIDLAFREPEGWVIADYKTDIGTDPEFPARVESYRRQVDLYAQAWTHLTGERVKERVLFFTAQNRVETW
ncbi:MAG: UvrD-helicase domain-containing protein [Gemmatimonadetes bacterium]|nr:UvrD-helicase domain-containing protein [Gemmatimonadota bacterium]